MSPRYSRVTTGIRFRLREMEGEERERALERFASYFSDNGHDRAQAREATSRKRSHGDSST